MRISSSMRPLDPNPHLPSLVHLAAPLPTPPPGSIRDRRRLWPPHLPPQPNPSSKTPATTRSPLQVSWETRCRLSFQSISLARSLLLSLSLSLSRPFWSIVTNQLSLPPVCPSVRPSVPPSLPLPLPPSQSLFHSLSLSLPHTDSPHAPHLKTPANGFSILGMVCLRSTASFWASVRAAYLTLLAIFSCARTTLGLT